MDALDWKRFYAEERLVLGERGLDALLDDAPAGSASVFPHTRAAVSGALVAAVARSVVASGAERVLAIGVLHGARREDAARVALARAGDPEARAELRRVHGPGGFAAEEFSLDAFGVLVERAARRAGVRPPVVVERYPFLVGADPEGLPGIEELAREAEGCAVVATTDPIHHGVGYGTAERRDPDDPATVSWATAAIRAQLDALEAGDWAGFAREAEAVRSDFRDTGPVLAWLLGKPRFGIEALILVDYADVLAAPRPTWVAAAAITVTARTGPRAPAASG